MTHLVKDAAVDPMDRRQALQTAGAAALGLVFGTAAPAAEKKPGATDLVPGKSDRLLVLGDKPIVLETPSDILNQHVVTPTKVLFVRNNQQLPGMAALTPGPTQGWKIAIDGLVQPLPVDELARLDQVEVEMVLQCSGNGRSTFIKAAPIRGTPWSRGGVGNVRFKGVPLATLVSKYKLAIKPEARFLTATARGQEGQVDFEHSLPLEDVLKKSLLALQLNGEPLPAVHGGPVRLVTPGYYGTMQVKWVTRLRFDKTETDNHYQMPQYRMPDTLLKPGSKFDFTFANSKASWRMKVSSFILTPAPNALLAAGQCTVRGVAFNDGEAKIESVLVSVDGGQTWQRARLETPASPYSWYPWSAHVELAKGAQQIWARATDALGRSQPLDGTIFWNPHGYEWNGVDKVAVVGK